MECGEQRRWTARLLRPAGVVWSAHQRVERGESVLLDKSKRRFHNLTDGVLANHSTYSRHAYLAAQSCTKRQTVSSLPSADALKYLV